MDNMNSTASKCHVDPWMVAIGTVFTGELISILTSAIAQMGLIWHIIMVTHSPLSTTLATLVGFIPTALLGPFAGVFVDRLPLKAVLIGADLSIAIVSIPIAVLAIVMPNIPVWVIFVILALRSLGQAFHNPAFNSMTPLIAPKHVLDRLSGISQGVQSTGYLIGTALAAVIYPVGGLGAMIGLDVVGAGLACVCVAFTRFADTRNREREETNGAGEALRAIVQEALSGWKVIRADKGLFALMMCDFLFTLAFSPLSALFAIYAIDYFHAGTTGASLTEVSWSLGMIIGSAVIGITGLLKPRWLSPVVACLVFGVGLVACGAVPPSGFIPFIVINTIMGLAMPMYNAAITVYMQERIQAEFLGRAFAFFTALSTWALPAGLIVSSFFVDSIDLPLWFIGSGIAIAVLATGMFFSSTIRSLK